MKKSITNRAKPSHYFYSILIMLLSVNLSFSQTVTKQYVSEVNLQENSVVFVKGPGSLPFKSEGKLKVNTTSGYALEPRDNDGIAAFTANILDIKTTNENLLRQIVKVKVIPHNNDIEDAKELTEALKIKIVKEGNEYRIDNNLNIESLSFKNGFFKGTQNIILLKDGSAYNVRGVEISAEIIISKEVKLVVTSKYINVAVDDFEGALEINADKSNIELSNVANLSGRFNSCHVKFKSIDRANMLAYNSEINGKTINYLNLGANELVADNSLLGNSKKGSLSKYRIDYVENLKVAETSNDEFKIREVGTIDVKSSHFSNYDIERLNKELSLIAKNGNLDIAAISEEVTKLTIDNQISTINLGVQELTNYIVRFPQLLYTEKTIPAEATEVSNDEALVFEKGKTTDKGIISISCKNCKVEIKD